VHFQLGRLYQKTGQSKLAASTFEESKALSQRKLTAAKGFEDGLKQSRSQQ
jgi:hypothetical protein